MSSLQRKWTLISIIILIPIGLYSKFYTGPASSWVNNSLGGILYVIFWSLVFATIFLNSNPWKIVSIVFLTTCLLEFLQLYHPFYLESIRGNFIGRALIGSSFSWLDLLHCVIGFAAGGVLLAYLRKK